MRKNDLIRLFGICLVVVFGCDQSNQREQEPTTTTPAEVALIPQVQTLSLTGGSFLIDEHASLQVDPRLRQQGEFLKGKIEERTGIGLKENSKNPSGSIFLKLSEKTSTDTEESYRLHIAPDSIVLSAATEVGIFRGIQTLRQLVPSRTDDTRTDHPVCPIPVGTITDGPRFAYRGTMLDVARHFFTVEELKRYIDVLAFYKINFLHLHLSDDQGWRIEIKSWPKLTEVGGQSEVGGGEGGFYTQEQYRELVEYAAERFITIVPEIDMPGHTNAASVAYPILNGNGKTPKSYTGIEVGFSTFDTRSDTVYAFIDDVVREIAALTPGAYFHIGGDESHVTKKEDYRYFVGRVEPIVRRYGKRMIGWDEVATAELDPSSVAQLWNSPDNARRAVERGMQVLVSPAKKAYLDMQYDSTSRHGLHWAAYIPVDTAYLWDPTDYLAEAHILGIEAPLWSETITNLDEAEYLAFPRLLAYAEIGWSRQNRRDWTDFRQRLAAHGPILERMGVDFYRSPRVVWKTDE